MQSDTHTIRLATGNIVLFKGNALTLEALNSILSSFQGETFNKRDDINILKRRIDDYLKKESDERFFLLPGLRSVGKTTLLLQCYEYLLKEKNVPQSNLLYISCDDLNATGESNLNEAVEIYLKNVFNTTVSMLNEEVFLFIDEAHYDKLVTSC